MHGRAGQLMAWLGRRVGGGGWRLGRGGAHAARHAQGASAGARGRLARSVIGLLGLGDGPPR
jgi:hypothetical protein